MFLGPKSIISALCGGLLLMACNPAAKDVADSDAQKKARIDEMYGEYHDEFPSIQEISADELATLQEETDIVIVDVREDKERAVSMIPGAISKSEFEDRIDEVGDKPVVVYCTIGYRSGLYVKELKEKGVDASNLAGSILSWTHAGQPVVDGEGNETNRVHVYGKQWNLLPEGMEGVW